MESLNTFFWNAGGFIVVLGVLIFIHEAGHFFMAKLLGIRVEVFSLGFGPRILGFRRGDTDYRVSAVPLGGYVKMLGEHPDEELAGSKEEFQSRTRFERFLVLVMGPAVNLAFAYLVYVAVFMAGVREPAFLQGPAVVGGVEEGGPAAEAGLQPGDTILSAGGEELASWQALRFFVVMNPDTEQTFTVERGGEKIQVPVRIASDNKHRQGEIGVLPPSPKIQVMQVTKGSPAEAAGLEEGDLILEAGGETIEWSDEGTSPLASVVQEHAGRPLTLKVQHEGEIRSLTVVPDEVEGTIGVAQGLPVKIIRHGLAGAAVEAARQIGEESLLLFKTVKKLVVGDLSMRALSGPMEIASYSGTFARTGFVPFLRFMGMVSLQLGIINLFPIPVLDGGHITILAAEGLVRREIPPSVKERIMTVGVVMLFALMAVVIYFDFVKLLFS